MTGYLEEPPVSDATRSAEALSIAGVLLWLALAPALAGCGSTLINETGGGAASLPEWKPFRYAPPAPGVPWRREPDRADRLAAERQAPLQ